MPYPLDANLVKYKRLRNWYQFKNPTNSLEDIGKKPGDELDAKNFQHGWLSEDGNHEYRVMRVKTSQPMLRKKE